jgi:putative FmdB family regulatory protein
VPIYEYACRACGRQFEALVLRKSVPACPECAGVDLERMLSLPVVRSESTKQQVAKSVKQRDARQASEQTRTQREYEAHHDD